MQGRELWLELLPCTPAITELAQQGLGGGLREGVKRQLALQAGASLPDPLTRYGWVQGRELRPELPQAARGEIVRDLVWPSRPETDNSMGAVQSKELRPELLQTAHSQKITDLALPHQYSEVFATCSFGEIRVWHLHSRRELLRISVPNLGCTCVAFMQVSGSPAPPQTAMPCSLCNPRQSMPRKLPCLTGARCPAARCMLAWVICCCGFPAGLAACATSHPEAGSCLALGGVPGKGCSLEVPPACWLTVGPDPFLLRWVPSRQVPSGAICDPATAITMAQTWSMKQAPAWPLP